MVDQVSALADMDLADLRRWYGGLGLPDEVGLHREELLALAKNFCIWENLPLHSLTKECSDKGIDPTQGSSSGAPRDDETLRQTMMSQLLADDRLAAWERRGYEARRLGSLDAATHA